jgi:hypothetical protein
VEHDPLTILQFRRNAKFAAQGTQKAVAALRAAKKA